MRPDLVGVVGAGLMGSGIAESVARAGIAATLLSRVSWSTELEALDGAHLVIEAVFEDPRAHGRLGTPRPQDRKRIL